MWVLLLFGVRCNLLPIENEIFRWSYKCGSLKEDKAPIGDALRNSQNMYFLSDFQYKVLPGEAYHLMCSFFLSLFVTNSSGRI